MIPLTCVTCGYFIGAIVIEYETKKTDICNNPELSDEQKASEISKLINSLDIRRYCCRMRLMTTKDIVYDVLTVSNN